MRSGTHQVDSSPVTSSLTPKSLKTEKKVIFGNGDSESFAHAALAPQSVASRTLRTLPSDHMTQFLANFSAIRWPNYTVIKYSQHFINAAVAVV